ncbi:MAG: hypothetical protein JWP35_981 [Caulobacter sp.]|nr:hypothetical protein [Caulobacter sp.]
MLSLSITGFDPDPDEVSRLLDLAPTATKRRGEIGPSGRASTFNGWWLEVPPALTTGGQHDAALNALLALLRERVAAFANLREVLKPTQITIYGGLYHKAEEQGGVWLDPDQMRVLADCGVGWGLDIFVTD